MTELSRNPDVNYYYFFDLDGYRDCYVALGCPLEDPRHRRAIVSMRLKAMNTRDPYAVGCIAIFARLSLNFSVLRMSVTVNDVDSTIVDSDTKFAHDMFNSIGVHDFALVEQLMVEYELTFDELQQRVHDVDDGPAWLRAAEDQIGLRMYVPLPC